MYTMKNYKTKNQLKDDLANGELVEVYQPGGFFPSQKDGEVPLEGPHSPQTHTWYARVHIKDGFITRMIS